MAALAMLAFVFLLLHSDLQGLTEGRDIAVNAERVKIVYLQSDTWTLKIVKSEKDILKECTYWKNDATGSQQATDPVSVADDMMRGLSQQCKRATGDKHDETFFQYPGTLWCGAGDSADNYTDLGELEEVDKCCRQHDNCKPYIEPFDTRFGLWNFAIWPKFHCKCDEQFYYCLKDVDTADSWAVGNMFFDVLEIGCFQKMPVMVCVDWSWFGWCNKWEPDKSQPKEWALVDNQFSY